MSDTSSSESSEPETKPSKRSKRSNNEAKLKDDIVNDIKKDNKILRDSIDVGNISQFLYGSGLNSESIKPFPTINAGVYSGIIVYSKYDQYWHYYIRLPLNEWTFCSIKETSKINNKKYSIQMLKLIKQLKYYNCMGIIEFTLIDTNDEYNKQFLDQTVKQYSYGFINKYTKTLTYVGYGMNKPGKFSALHSECEAGQLIMNNDNTKVIKGDFGKTIFDEVAILELENINEKRKDRINRLKKIQKQVEQFSGNNNNNNKIPKLFTKVKINLISNIDNVSQSFFCKLLLVYYWPLNDFDIKNYIQNPKYFKPSWSPDKPYFINATSIDEFEIEDITVINEKEKKLLLNNNEQKNEEKNDEKNDDDIPKDNDVKMDDQQTNIIEHSRDILYAKIVYKVSGTFYENLELLNYPFDSQDLHILIDTNMTTNYCDIIPNYNGAGNKADYLEYYNDQNLSSEWQFYKPFFAILKKKSSKYIDESLCEQEIIVDLKMQRNYITYIYRVFMVVAIMEGLCLATFALDAQGDTGDRLAFSVTILLTVVAYSIVVASNLPNLCYLTILDKYIIASYVFIGAVIVQTAILAIESAFTPNIVDITDTVFAIILAVIYLMAHLYLIIKVQYYTIPFEKNKLNQIELQTETSNMSIKNDQKYTITKVNQNNAYVY